MEILEARHLVQVALAAQPDILEILRAVLQDLEPVHGDEHDLAPSPRSFSAYARLQFGAAAAVRRAIVARTLHGLTVCSIRQLQPLGQAILRCFLPDRTFSA